MSQRPEPNHLKVTKIKNRQAIALKGFIKASSFSSGGGLLVLGSTLLTASIPVLGHLGLGLAASFFALRGLSQAVKSFEDSKPEIATYSLEDQGKSLLEKLQKAPETQTSQEDLLALTSLSATEIKGLDDTLQRKIFHTQLQLATAECFNQSLNPTTLNAPDVAFFKTDDVVADTKISTYALQSMAQKMLSHPDCQGFDKIYQEQSPVIYPHPSSRYLTMGLVGLTALGSICLAMGAGADLASLGEFDAKSSFLPAAMAIGGGFTLATSQKDALLKAHQRMEQAPLSVQKLQKKLATLPRRSQKPKTLTP